MNNMVWAVKKMVVETRGIEHITKVLDVVGIYDTQEKAEEAADKANKRNIIQGVFYSVMPYDLNSDAWHQWAFYA